VKILCINHEYPPIGGGGAVACQMLAEALTGAGHEVDVVTSRMPDLPTFEERNKVCIHRVSCVRRYRHYATAPELATFLLPAYRRALSLVRSRHYDLNHTHFVLPGGIVSRALWARTKLPYVITAHGSDVPGYNPDRFRLLHRAVHSAWRVVLDGSRGLTAPSRFLRDLIAKSGDLPVEVIPYAFAADPLNGAPRVDRLLVVTRMFPRKGVQYVIEALAGIGTSWEICIVGDGPYRRELEGLASRLGVAAKFLGYVQGAPLANLYQSSRVFVFPSLQENFPLVLLEAMAAGCAIVTTDATGCAEVVGASAIRVSPADVGALEQVLRRLLSDDAEVDHLGRAARQRVARFAPQQIAAEYVAFFERCLGTDGPAALSVAL
jgi:glycosyltransferase involved in cell wall biosynthesis